MKQLTLSKQSARVLELNVSGKEGGMNPRDSRKWARIVDKLLDPMEDYDGPAQALIDEAQEIAQADLGDDERSDQIRRINREMRALDDTLGADQVTIVLESDEFTFVSEIWWTLKFPADRRTRTITGAVSDALDAAIDVKIEDGHVVPVDKPVAESRSPNGKAKHLARVR